MSECKIVAVLNRKGGVCKTTTTHNLGVALVQRGYRVLLVDCDTQRNLSISLGLNRPDEECYTLCELLQPLIDVEVDEVDIQNCIHHLENGVDFIPNKQALSLSLDSASGYMEQFEVYCGKANQYIRFPP
mgnify:CR=1 FL=1